MKVPYNQYKNNYYKLQNKNQLLKLILKN